MSTLCESLHLDWSPLQKTWPPPKDCVCARVNVEIRDGEMDLSPASTWRTAELPELLPSELPLYPL